MCVGNLLKMYVGNVCWTCSLQMYLKLYVEQIF